MERESPGLESPTSKAPSTDTKRDTKMGSETPAVAESLHEQLQKVANDRRMRLEQIIRLRTSIHNDVARAMKDLNEAMLRLSILHRCILDEQAESLILDVSDFIEEKE